MEFQDLSFKLNPLNDIVTPTIGPMEQIVKGWNSNFVFAAFSNSVINLTDRLSANIGVTSQLFTLNNSWTLEPRVALQYKLTHKSNLSVAYGLHSRREKLDYYYVQIEDQLVNNDLTFAKAHHLVLSYDLGITDNIHLRIEPYYQYLYDVPVDPNTSFSIINNIGFYLDLPLVNEGNGRNYGVDITLERYLSKSYYWLFTGSLFSSTYKGGDGVWHNTRYNRKFIVNGLIGKEWMCGKLKQNVFSANIGLSFQGGTYDSPVDKKASAEQERVVFDDAKAFSIQNPSSLTVDFSVGYKINRRKVSHEISLKVLNATAAGAADQSTYFYNQKTKEVTKDGFPVTIPNISYKIHF